MWKISHIAFIALTLCSCESTPPLEKRAHEPNVVSIAYLKSQYPGVPRKIRADMSIEGRVVANDRWGNFYKTIVVQDESGAIEVKLDANELFLAYPYGELVRINCNGLALGAYGGSVQLGVVSEDGSYETGFIPMNRIVAAVKLVPGNAQEPIPIPLTIAHLHNLHFDAWRYLNCLVTFSQVQFVDHGAVVPWAEGDVAATDRLLTDIQGNMLVVRTSALADFANETLPMRSGTIRGILGWFNGTPQLVVYDPREVIMRDDRF